MVAPNICDSLIWTGDLRQRRGRLLRLPLHGGDQMPVKVPCRHCDGTGSAKLPEPLQETFDLIRKGHETAKQIFRACPNRGDMGITAIQRRLERLMETGLVERKLGDDQTYHYSIL